MKKNCSCGSRAIIISNNCQQTSVLIVITCSCTGEANGRYETPCSPCRPPSPSWAYDQDIPPPGLASAPGLFARPVRQDVNILSDVLP